MHDQPVVSDRAYDEAIPVETDDEEVSTPGSSEAGSPPAAKAAQQPQRGGLGGPQPMGKDDDSASESSSSEGSTSSDSSDDDVKGGKAQAPSGAYNPEDYAGLKVSEEVQELFGHITRYKPHNIELVTSLKPFIPEFVPSIGEVDAFLKMARPDGLPSNLGTVRLDEPALVPTNPSILEMQLRALSKNQELQPMEVRSIENAEKKPLEIENWVKKVEDLNRTKPAASVQYTRRMPDIEQLMQVWSSEFEEYLQNNPLPDMADLDLELKDYIKVIASILDVPVHGQLTETLHVIFTLYSEFKTNQHFSKTETLGQGPDPYNFSNVGTFAHMNGAGAAPAGATGPVFGNPNSESMAPSRAPSPAGGRQH
eukprot:CAMPEP_0206459800 /NCGR_PEP_ID=MMETSP0324_2-20121206/24386_1 /ASSEMBLY_ACC=CAM_ASM_000836 /TAXON_ID=2866 /ORGANISM="Crypthecodinium cohnii, Strain Seligo" /LENGTH=366 /DNA_ID=CAMNT_0053931409 /DNA_START=55 /DNA_END=1155 /DNA_ORIENTATION=+